MADDMTANALTSNGPLSIHEPGPLVLAVGDGIGRTLVRLKVVDGRMTAAYDPADLDEAARIFWDSMARYFNTKCPEGSTVTVADPT